jgi:hypothetical protein
LAVPFITAFLILLLFCCKAHSRMSYLLSTSLSPFVRFKQAVG